MGAVYKTKKRSCKMCKPHKMGWEPKRKPKHEAKKKADEREMRESTRNRLGA